MDIFTTLSFVMQIDTVFPNSSWAVLRTDRHVTKYSCSLS